MIRHPHSPPKGFSLVEVVLAIGVIAIAVVALLGLMIPTLSSVRDVIDTSEATAAMTKFNSYLDEEPTFDELFDTVETGGDYYVYETIDTDGVTTTRITDDTAQVESDFQAGIDGTGGIEGSVYRFLLSQSSMWDADQWAAIDEEAYFPIFIRVLLEQPVQSGGNYVFQGSTDADYIEENTILTYTTARLR